VRRSGKTSGGADKADPKALGEVAREDDPSNKTGGVLSTRVP